MKNDNSIIIIDYQSLNIDYQLSYKCKPHYHTDLDKLIRYVIEMRKKYKQQNG